MRTAELHVALASDPNDPLFAPERYDIMHQQSMYGSVTAHMARTFNVLRNKRASLPPERAALAPKAPSILSDSGLVGANCPDVAFGVTDRVLVASEDRVPRCDQDFCSCRVHSLEVGVDLGAVGRHDADRRRTRRPGVVG